ncbi:MAG: phospho-N-acetylmuramoyl-pentapeptide-transferase, partial [Gemmatimonadetes bacterium]|nr:phospho-N-acetylmuramoyl-pentapeptide-transferase [Gemmatimonadota bacterium]
MLYDLLFPLQEYFTPLRLFQYQSFRAAGAAVTALLLAFVVGPRIIVILRRMQVHQAVRDGTPESHQGKHDTPTMGGFIILTSVLLPTLLWMRTNNRYVWIALITTLWMGGIGFLDDYLKVRQRRLGLKNEGLVER